MDSNRFSTTTTNTFETTDTGSSATTIWGPGTLSGKAIKSLGEASLRGVEKLIVRWRLAKINSVLPGSSSGSTSVKSPNALNGDQLEKIYDDLLELSRLDFYDAKVRHKALRMIMMQIGSRETSQLITCIMKWPQQEIMIFLSEMMPCMPLLWDSEATEASTANLTLKARLELIDLYRSSQSSKEALEILPFLSFISALAQENSNACRAVEESGFLEILILAHRQHSASLEVASAGRIVVRILLEGQPGSDTACHTHRLDLVWPRAYRSNKPPLAVEFLALSKLTPNMRRAEWKAMPKNLVGERLAEIAAVLSMPEFHSDCEEDFFDMCFDMLVFRDLDDDGLGDFAIIHLLQCVAIGGEASTALQNVLVLLTYNDNLDFFYRIIYPLLRMKTDALPTAIYFCNEVDRWHPNADAVAHFAEFAISVASRSQASAQAILDADIVALLSTSTKTGELIRSLQTAVKKHDALRADQQQKTRGRSGTV